MKENQVEDGNWDSINSAISTLEEEAKRFCKMKTWTETIHSNSGKILKEIRELAERLDEQIGILRVSVVR